MLHPTTLGRWTLRALSATLAGLVLGSGFAAAADPKPAEKSARAATPAAKLTSDALAHRIDQIIDERLREEKVPASPRADDGEFLRRVYLDLTGHVPPAEKVTAFLDNADPKKRAKLIDELLASPEYGKHQADVWQNLLLPRNSDNRRLQLAPMVKWLEDAFNADKAWDQMVREIVTASGEQDKNGAVTFFLANPTPDKLTDEVTRLFLGVRLECAQCHNHPFTSWKQDEYWGMAAFFTKVRIEGNPRQAQQGQATLAISEDGKGRPIRLPVSAKKLPPKFLQGDQPKVGNNEPIRPVLADWMTAPTNPYFTKAMVNRTWGQLFGRGIVNPVDDMTEANPPSHPQLLAELADQFAANGFDLKFLTRAICNSQAYQCTSKPFGKNADAAPEMFSRMAVKVLSPEQMFDSLVQMLGAPGQPARQARQGQNGRNLGGNPRAAFVAFFQVEEGSDPTEYQGGIPQALRLMNSPQLNNAAMLNQFVKPGQTPAQIIEHVYTATLARRPTPRETNRLTAYVNKHSGEPRQAYADILWALLNSSEFTLNH